MLGYLFGFRGRINRGKFWLFWLVAGLGEAAAVGLAWTVGWFAKLDEPMEATSPFFLSGDSGFALRLGSGIIVAYFILYGWSLAAVSVKRLHDRNKSALWALFFWGTPALVFAILSSTIVFRLLSERTWEAVGPFAGTTGGAIMWWGLIEMLFFRGTKGENRFGRDPLGSQTSGGAM
jgi:uncharacterized membrane protein YhaH (DUF805 family)